MQELMFKRKEYLQSLMEEYCRVKENMEEVRFPKVAWTLPCPYLPGHEHVVYDNGHHFLLETEIARRICKELTVVVNSCNPDQFRVRKIPIFKRGQITIGTAIGIMTTGDTYHNLDRKVPYYDMRRFNFLTREEINCASLIDLLTIARKGPIPRIHRYETLFCMKSAMELANRKLIESLIFRKRRFFYSTEKGIELLKTEKSQQRISGIRDPLLAKLQNPKTPGNLLYIRKERVEDARSVEDDF